LVEPLLHFVVPLVTLRAVGLDWKSALFASFVALTPDLDVFFLVHRSASHSIIVLLVIVIPILILARRNPTIRNLTLLAAFAVTTHLMMDVFQTSTPLLWPLYGRDIEIVSSLNFQIGSGPTLVPNVAVETRPVDFASFETFDAPLITAEGAGIALVLLAPIVTQIVISRKRASKKASANRRG
jgi:hypothetical protein